MVELVQEMRSEQIHHQTLLSMNVVMFETRQVGATSIGSMFGSMFVDADFDLRPWYDDLLGVGFQLMSARSNCSMHRSMGILQWHAGKISDSKSDGC